MGRPVTVPNAFASQSGNVPASQLDANFSALKGAIDDPQSYVNYGLDTGAPNAYVTTLSPAPSALADGLTVTIKIGAGNTSTGACTLNVNGLTAIAIKRQDGTTDMAANDLIAGALYVFIYSSTLGVWLCMNPSTTSPVPAGTILAYGGAAAPTGYLLCDGTSYLQASFPNLFAAIGTAFGSADGTHFNVPDLRGRFLRGRDAAAGRDPDAGTRTAMNAGGATGDNIGSVEGEQFKSHTHNVDLRVAASTFGGTGIVASTNAFHDTALASEAAGGNETRPINANVNYIIKT